MDQLFAAIDNNTDRFLDELKQLLRLSSISAASEEKQTMVDTAQWLVDHLKAIGVAEAEVCPTAGHPVVFAQHPGPAGAPTVLIYGHYDVQPVDPLDLWTTPPFEPEIRDGKIWGRGTTDDKGQLFCHLKALETILRDKGELPVTVKMIFEGEEEIGSPSLAEFIAANRERLACDVVLVSDTSMYAKGTPSIQYGLRGLVYFQVDVEAAKGDLHSGSYGGGVADPINVAAQILASMHDENHRIAIDGVYDDVLELTPEDQKAYDALPYSEDDFLDETGAPTTYGEKGFSPPVRMSARPSLDANGIWGGFAGEGAKTVLPAKAGFKVSMRLVPNQDPQKIAAAFRKHVEKVAPDAVRVKITEFTSGPPFICPLDEPALQKAAQALARVFGKDCLYTREGGSIPIVSEIAAALSSPVILMGFGLNSENAHAPDEHFDLDNFVAGIKTSIVYLHLLADQG